VGGILKILYDKWIDGYPLPNGIPKHVVRKMVTELKVVNSSTLCDYLSHYAKTTLPVDNWFNTFYRYIDKKDVIYLTDLDIDSDDIIIYPFEIMNVDSIYQEFIIKGKGETYDKGVYLVDTIPGQILNHIKSGRIKILFNQIQDPFMLSTAHGLNKGIEFLESLGIDRKNVIFLAGSEQAYGCNYNVFTSDTFFAKECAREMSEMPFTGGLGYVSDYIRTTELDKNQYRKSKFLSFNRNLGHREHRVWLLYNSVKNGWINQGLFSFIEDIHVPWDKFPKNNEDLKSNIVTICQNLLPLEIDTMKIPRNQKRGFPTNNNKKELYTDTYIHITSETKFFDGEVFFSEKTFRPIINLQPFIYLGDFGALKKLQKLGFKTFHPFIDETYDTVENPIDRLNLIEKEINKIAKMTLEEVHELYYNVEDILIHNQEHLKIFNDVNPLDPVFKKIKEMYNGN
jgi:hypothetical protein